MASWLDFLSQTYLLETQPRETWFNTIEIAHNENKRAQDLASIFKRNQAYYGFLEFYGPLSDKILKWEEEANQINDRENVVLNRALGLLGKVAARNLIACFRLRRANQSGLPRSMGELLKINLMEQLKYSSFCQDVALEKRYSFSENAYLAGFHYDLLSALISRFEKGKEHVLHLDRVFREGFQIATLSYEIAKKLKTIPYENYIFAAGLLCPIGKVLMSILYPKEKEEGSWVSFLTEVEKLGDDRLSSFLLFEKDAFEVRHQQLTALFISYGKFFRAIEKPLYYYLEPYLLRTVAPKAYFLGELLNLSASLICRSPDGIKKFQVENEFQQLWVKKNSINLDDVKKIAIQVKQIKDFPK